MFAPAALLAQGWPHYIANELFRRGMTDIMVPSCLAPQGLLVEGTCIRALQSCMTTIVYALAVEQDHGFRDRCEAHLTRLYTEFRTCVSLLYRFVYGKVLGKALPLLPASSDQDIRCLELVSRTDICHDIALAYRKKYAAAHSFSAPLRRQWAIVTGWVDANPRPEGV